MSVLKLLLVVDMQNDFVDGALGFDGASSVIEPICKKIEEYRNGNYDVYFTRDVHGVDYLQTEEGKKLPIEHCIAGQSGSEIVPQLQKYLRADSVLENKNSFGSLGLGDFLKEKQYESVEVCGLVSNICVLFAAIIAKAALPEAEIIVDENCTASFDAQLHAKTLDVLAGCQFNILRKGN